MIRLFSLGILCVLLGRTMLDGAEEQPLNPYSIRVLGGDGEQPTTIHLYLTGVKRLSRQLGLWADAIREGNKSPEEFSAIAAKARFAYFILLRSEQAFKDEGQSRLKSWPPEIQQLWASVDKPKLEEAKNASAGVDSKLMPSWIDTCPIEFFQEKLRSRAPSISITLPREWRFEKAPASKIEE